MDLDATEVYPSFLAVALAELRQRISIYPEALLAEPAELSRRLAYPEAEVEAAREWLIADGLEIRA